MNRLSDLLPEALPPDTPPEQKERAPGPAEPEKSPEPTVEGTVLTESPERREARLRWEPRRAAFYNQAEGARHKRDGVDCPVCRNKGYIYRLTEEGDMVSRKCGCMAKRETLRKIRESGLGEVIRDYTFDKFETKEAWQRELKEAAQAFCKDGSAGWFYIGGQVGSGKTHLCTAICGEYIRRGYDVRYLMWAEKSKHLKALINDCRAYTDMMNEYKRIPVLYIDDFLKVRQGADPSDADLNLAFELINARLLQPEKITVISAEKTVLEAMEYDEATFSRIYRLCGKYNLAVGRDRGRNYRLG